MLEEPGYPLRWPAAPASSLYVLFLSSFSLLAFRSGVKELVHVPSFTVRMVINLAGPTYISHLLFPPSATPPAARKIYPAHVIEFTPQTTVLTVSPLE